VSRHGVTGGHRQLLGVRLLVSGQWSVWSSMQRISTSQPLNDTHVTARRININSLHITSTIPLKIRRRVRIPDSPWFFVLRFLGKYPAMDVRYCESAMAQKLMFSTGPGVLGRAEREEAIDSLDRTSCDSLFHSEMILGKNEYILRAIKTRRKYSECVRVRVS